MAWPVIARQDGRLTLRARSVKVLLGLLAVGVLLAAYLYPLMGEDPITTTRFSGFVGGWLTTMIPIVGVLLGYNAVASERESGALLLSLSLPHSRRDLVLGKFAGRAGLLAVTIVGAMIVAGALVVYPFGELELPGFIAFVLLTVVFGAAWTGIGVAVSLSVATRRRALALGIGILFLFVFAWDAAEQGLRLGLNVAGIVDGELPGVAQFVFSLSPDRAFTRVIDGFINPAGSVDGAWYVGEWVALVVLFGWLVVPLLLASLRFAGSDLA